MLKVLETTNKNNAESKWHFSPIKEDIKLLTYQEDKANEISLTLDPSVVQYFFCLSGGLKFSFAPANYQLELEAGESYFFYNPEKSLQPHIKTSPNTKLVFIFASLEKIHSLFLGHQQGLNFLQGDNVNKKYYKKTPISSDLEVVLNQLIAPNVQGCALEVFRFAKVLEVFSLYFSKEASTDNEYCPYLNDDESVRRIKEAKEILIKHLDSPPTIRNLALQVGLNEFRLKEGFKSLYGTTLFHYLLDYKMNKGKHLLDSGKYIVKEVAYELGYSNPSHFISAFKNKFGITPKKYSQNK